MKNNATIIYALFLAFGDFVTLLASFIISYAWLFKLEDRPNLQLIGFQDYIMTVLAVLPVWIAVHALIGLYQRNVYDNRFRETGRLIVGSFIGILLIMSYDFLSNEILFPGRVIILASFATGFILLVLFRAFSRLIRALMFHYGIGVNNVLIVGGGHATEALIAELSGANSGYRILGIVGKAPDATTQFDDFDTAVSGLKELPLHSIIQTELYKRGELNAKIMAYAQMHHISYRFIPGNNELFVGNIEVELFKGTPVVTVHQTALIGWGRIVKRVFDVMAGIIFLIIAAPFMLLIAAAIKINDPKGPVLMKGIQQVRLTQFNREFKVFKFRSHYAKFDGKTYQEVFDMIGKPELLEEYVRNGYQMEKDFRVTPIGRFIRAASLDELPQLINVIKGDISLVGPRALIPEELKTYQHKHHILSVKSGLTGLAQVSGRKNISFEERRKLDVYYVQNWTFWLDVTILLKTLRAVINGIGAK